MINFSAKIFEMGNTNVRKRQTSPVNHSLSVVRGGNATASQAGSSSYTRVKYINCVQPAAEQLVYTDFPGRSEQGPPAQESS